MIDSFAIYNFANALEENAPGGTFNEPWDVAVAPDGSVFVADTFNHRIQKFDSTGRFIKMWGIFAQGDTPESFWGPRGITVTEDIVPSEAFVDQEVSISGWAVDVNSDPIQNGDISIEIPRIGESWSTTTDDNGYYTIQIAAPYIGDDTPSTGEFGSDGVIVRCVSNDLQGFCVKTLLIIENYPPYIPSIDGPASGKIGEEHEYNVSTIDPDGDTVFYFVDWGDDQTDEWIGPYDSGEEVVVSHTWDEQGTFYIRVKARDGYDSESEWGELEVTMPRNRIVDNSFFFNFLERFPNVFPMIRYIFGLS